MKRIMIDTTTYNISDAEPILNDIINAGLTPSFETWTLLLDGYCAKGEMEAAHETVEKMKTEGIEPTKETYASLIAGYHEHGKIKDAATIIQRFSALEAKDYINKHENVLNKE